MAQEYMRPIVSKMNSSQRSRDASCLSLVSCVRRLSLIIVILILASAALAEGEPKITLALSTGEVFALDPADAVVPTAENIRLIVQTDRWGFVKITPPPPHQISGITERESWHSMAGSLSLDFQILLAPSTDLKLEFASSSDAATPEAIAIIGFEPENGKFRIRLKEGRLIQPSGPQPTEGGGFRPMMVIVAIALVAIAGVLFWFIRQRKTGGGAGAPAAASPIDQSPAPQPKAPVAIGAVEQTRAYAAGAASTLAAAPASPVANEEPPSAELSSSIPTPPGVESVEQPGQGAGILVLTREEAEDLSPSLELQQQYPAPVLPRPEPLMEQTITGQPEGIQPQQKEEIAAPEPAKTSESKSHESLSQLEASTTSRMNGQSVDIQEINERVRDIERQMKSFVERLETKIEDMFLNRLTASLYQEHPELRQRVSEIEQEISNRISRGASQEVDLEALLQQAGALNRAVEAIFVCLKQRGDSAKDTVSKIAAVSNNLKALINELSDWQMQRAQQRIKLRLAVDLPEGEAGRQALVDGLAGSLSNQIKKLQDPDGYFRGRLEQIATSHVMHVSDVCDQEIDQNRENGEIQSLLKNLFDAAGMEEISARGNEPYRPADQKVVQFVTRQSPNDQSEAVACLVARGFRYKGNVLRKAYVMLFSS